MHPHEYMKLVEKGGPPILDAAPDEVGTHQREFGDLVRGRDPPERFLRWPEVQALVGVSRTTWWRMIRAGAAPKGLHVSTNCVAWRASDIAAFQAACAPSREEG
jgi:predicted DNA-binding transcriptional regulator AlpA